MTPPADLPIEIEGKGISFDREFNGDGVEVCVEYDDLSSFRGGTLERYITIARADWERIVDALLGQPDPEVERLREAAERAFQVWSDWPADPDLEDAMFALGDALRAVLSEQEGEMT